VKPQTKKKRLRPHALLVWFGVLGAVAASVFLYFGLSQP
jgi:NhaP-type Na+/H+ or K+/H+ antiporter